MPKLESNKRTWDGDYAWPHGGDEWSAAWGGPEAQWHGSLLPRLRPFLPAATILEIAPGFGRWTRFLADECERLVLVDLSEQCIDACRTRFARLDHLDYHVNDGTSLDMCADGSVDLVFSFDSLVHADDEVLGAYVTGLSRILTDDGIGFLHHSNLGELEGDATGNPHTRDETMSAARLRELCELAGLRCVGQEILNWGGPDLADCISLVTRPGSSWDRPNVVRRNPNFTAEMESIRATAEVYGS